MTNFKYEKQAYNAEPLPMRLELHEKAFYIFLVNLYDSYKKGLISKARAVQNKEEFYNECMTLKGDIDFLKRDTAKLKTGLAETSKAYAENRTLENADKMFKCFWNTSEVKWEE